MSESTPIGWRTDKEKLRGLLMLSDKLAPFLSRDAGEAFFRAFIIQDRANGAIRARWRFRYKQHGDSWFQAEQRQGEQPKCAVERMRNMLTDMLMLSVTIWGLEIAVEDVLFFEPPDDGGYPDQTIVWLLERDLIERTKPDEHAPGRSAS